MKKIKSKKSFHIVLDAGEQMVEKTLLSEITYSPEEKVTKEVFYNDGEPAREVAYTYDGGLLVRSEEKDHQEETFTKKEFQYSSGLLSRKREWYNDEDYIDTVTEYNSEGKALHTKEEDNEGELHGRTEYEYDPANRTTTANVYGDNGELASRIITRRDEKGNHTEDSVELFSGGFSVTERNETRYNDAGQPEEIKSFHNDRLIRVTTIEYENGKKIRQTVEGYESGEDYTYEYSYGDGGKQQEVRISANGALKIVQKYEYNDQGETVSVRNENIIDAQHTVCEIELHEIGYW